MKRCLVWILSVIGIRPIILTIGSILGLIAGALHAYLYYKIKGPFHDTGFAFQAWFMSSFITFVAVIYYTGIFGYRFLGYKKEYEEVLKTKKWHMRILNGFYILVLICSWFLPSGS
jgi:hypothetical protein